MTLSDTFQGIFRDGFVFVIPVINVFILYATIEGNEIDLSENINVFFTNCLKISLYHGKAGK
jgi:hypothetical protein